MLAYIGFYVLIESRSVSIRQFFIDYNIENA